MTPSSPGKSVPAPERQAVAIADMDDTTLESAAVIAAMTHRATSSREAWQRLLAINAERRRRKQVAV